MEETDYFSLLLGHFIHPSIAIYKPRLEIYHNMEVFQNILILFPYSVSVLKE
jgi:hypothetical protein